MNWLSGIPKAELHLHLEGAIPVPALWELVKKYDGKREVTDMETLRERFVYTDFPHFIETWVWKNGFLREYDDFTLLSEAVARDLAGQSIRYVEASFSPSDFFCHGLETQRLAEAIRAGLDKVPDVEVLLIADLVRDRGPSQAARVLAQTAEVRGLGVIGVGLGGSEHEFPPAPFADVYEEARGRGLRTSVHAGEAAGAESVWEAIQTLRPDRIGHGTRVAEDENLLDHLVKTGIPLELCPLSNLKTGVVDSIEEHPARIFFERGIVITINTDDPKMFGNSLEEEYGTLMEIFGFSRDEILSLILQAVRSSWLPDERKEKLIEDFTGDPAWEA